LPAVPKVGTLETDSSRSVPVKLPGKRPGPADEVSAVGATPGPGGQSEYE
jgi:hypothetical protein